MNNESKKAFIFNILYILSVCILFFITVKFLLIYLLPFVIALFVAILVQKPANKISDKLKIKSGIISAFLAAVVYILLAALFVFIVYRIYLLLGDIMNSLPSISGKINSFLSDAEQKLTSTVKQFSPELSDHISTLAKSTISNLTLKISEYVSSAAAAAAKKAPSLIFSSIVTLVASCFIAKDFKGFTKFASGLLGNRYYSNILKIKHILSESVLKILKGYLLLMALTFAELSAGFLILKVKYAIAIAAVIAFIDILPVLGTGAVLIPWSIFCFFSGNTSDGVGLIILYSLITVVRNFAEPKIIGNQMGIHPLFTLIAMFIGIKIFGFAGLFILPVTLIVIVKYYKEEMEQEETLTL